VAAFGPRMREPGAACLVTTCGQIEISDRQNREGQHPLSAGPRAGYRRDWLIVWRLEKARAHGGLPNSATPISPTRRYALAGGFDFSFSTFGKTMPFFGNILPTLRSYSGIEYPPGQRLRLNFAFAAERPGSGLRADAATSRVLTRDRRQGRRDAASRFGAAKKHNGRQPARDKEHRGGGRSSQRPRAEPNQAASDLLRRPSSGPRRWV
jgi:hypothetical protein